MNSYTPNTIAAYPLPPLGQRVVVITIARIPHDPERQYFGIHHGLMLDEHGDTVAIVNIDGENQLRAVHYSRVKLAGEVKP